MQRHSGSCWPQSTLVCPMILIYAPSPVSFKKSQPKKSCPRQALTVLDWWLIVQSFDKERRHACLGAFCPKCITNKKSDPYWHWYISERSDQDDKGPLLHDVQQRGGEEWVAGHENAVHDRGRRRNCVRKVHRLLHPCWQAWTEWGTSSASALSFS